MGDGTLVGEVLSRSTKGTSPLLGSALSHPVSHPHPPTEMINQIMTLCWEMSKTAALVAGAKLTLIPRGHMSKF